MNTDYLVISLYGPNWDDPEFYVTLEERLNDIVFEFVWNRIGLVGKQPLDM